MYSISCMSCTQIRIFDLIRSLILLKIDATVHVSGVEVPADIWLQFSLYNIKNNNFIYRYCIMKLTFCLKLYTTYSIRFYHDNESVPPFLMQ
jgi:hypothetical protein